MLNEYIGKYSPFSYNTPVNYDSYTGRKKIIKNILKQSLEVKKGKTVQYILTGESGFGKTSTVLYIEEYLSNKMHTIYIQGEYTESVPILATEILETLLNLFPQRLSDAIKINMFKDSTNDLEPYSNDIKNYLPSYLEYICKYLKKPVLIIIDDIDKLLKEKTFTNWYESINNTIKDNTNLPVFFILTCQKENYQETPESFKKIVYKNDELKCLNVEEVEGFYKNAFESVGMEIETDLWDENPYYSLINFTSGIPWLMQTIGEKVFQHAHYQDRITQYDIDQGLIDAANITYNRELKPLYEKYFKDPIFNRIYGKCVEVLANDNFSLNDFKEFLSPDELIFVEDYLKKAEELNLIEKHNENFSFTNHLYSIYFTEKKLVKIKEEY